MKRFFTHLAMTALVLMTMSGCSKNNGDIGLWFGLWHLDSIEVNGEPDDAYDGNYYFLFQNKVFCIRWVDEINHDYIESFAEWQEGEGGKTLTINFVDNRYSSRVSEAIADPYFSEVTTMDVLTLTSTSMVLSHVTPEGSTITYRLTKWK
jgi:hypothetical protein